MTYDIITLYMQLIDKAMADLRVAYGKLDKAYKKIDKLNALIMHFKLVGAAPEIMTRVHWLCGWCKGAKTCAEIDIRVLNESIDRYRAEIERLGDSF